MRIAGVSKWLLLALAAMFVQQTFAAMGRNIPTVIAPAIIDDLSIDPAWIGVYVAIGALAALVFQLGCGSFIIRFGALRTSQAALLMLAIALAAAALAGPMAVFIIVAVIGAGGSAISTPASSHLLGRYSPPRQAPLVFSIKQTAVPVGLLLAGLAGPALTGLWGWRAAMLIGAAACAGFALMLEPLRREFDADRNPEARFHLSDFLRTIRVVTRGRELLALSLGCFAFNGLQMVFTAYFVTWLVEMGHGLALAGAVFAVSMIVAVPGRILWGWVGSTVAAPGTVMGALALGMAVGAVGLGLTGAGTPLVIIGAMAIVISLTALSWHGVLLSEAARLAPEGMRGAATGGVLSFGQLGGLLLPLVYSASLWATGGHGLGFALCGVPALAAGIAMLWRRQPNSFPR